MDNSIKSASELFILNDKQIVENIDINYIISYFKSKGEDCVRILHARYFDRDVQKYELADTIIIEPLDDKPSYVYQDGHRTFVLDRNGSIVINTYFDKTGIYDSDHSLSRELYQHCLDYKEVLRDKKINEII